MIWGAGYKGPAVEAILTEWLPLYLNDLPRFAEMLESYERNNFDPD